MSKNKTNNSVLDEKWRWSDFVAIALYFLFNFGFVAFGLNLLSEPPIYN